MVRRQRRGLRTRGEGDDEASGFVAVLVGLEVPIQCCLPESVCEVLLDRPAVLGEGGGESVGRLFQIKDGAGHSAVKGQLH